MSWIVETQARERVWFESHLVPLWVQIGQKVDGQMWTLAFRVLNVSEDNATIACVDFSVLGPVTGEHLQGLDLEELGRFAYREWLNAPVYAHTTREAKIMASGRDWTDIAYNVGRNQELAEVAWVYLQAPTRGTKNVMDVMGYGSRATASLRVKEAREQNLIPPAGASKEEFQKALEAARKAREENGN